MSLHLRLMTPNSFGDFDRCCSFVTLLLCLGQAKVLQVMECKTLDKDADTEGEDAYTEKRKAGSNESSGGLYVICCPNHCYQDTNHSEARITSVV